MRKRVQIKPIPVEVDGQLRPNSRAVAFTVGFAHESPELAMRVANELVTLIVNGDERSRSGKTTEMIKLLASQAKDIEDKLDSTQMQILEVARRPRELTPEIPEEQKVQLTELANLKAQLSQKLSVYSDGHPAVTALKKRIAAMEKQITRPLQVPAELQSTPDDEIDGLKRQRQVLEKQLGDANAKLASARLREKLDLAQQEGMQVIEAPSLPLKPEKSKKILIVGFAFAAAIALGMGAAIGPGLLDGSIRDRRQLTGIVASPLIVCIPHIATRSDVVRRRLKILLNVVTVLIFLAIWGGLITAIVHHMPVSLSSLDKATFSFRTVDK